MFVAAIPIEGDAVVWARLCMRVWPSRETKGIITCSDNYRPIALAPTLSKVLEWCILLIYGDSFSTSPLQFGFKPGMSADMCTGLIKNVISRYCFNGSNVFGCFLDALKAFDRVSHAPHVI